jgi:hypothetical protein
MASSTHSAPQHAQAEPEDAVESVIGAIPVVLPMVGAALIFLLAFIAVSMA